jgi:hypothetical protein
MSVPRFKPGSFMTEREHSTNWAMNQWQFITIFILSPDQSVYALGGSNTLYNPKGFALVLCLGYSIKVWHKGGWPEGAKYCSKLCHIINGWPFKCFD